MKITDLRLRQLTGSFEHEGEYWEERLNRPIDIYPEHKTDGPMGRFGTPTRLEDGRYQLKAVYLQIDTDEGVSGLAGPIVGEVGFIIDQAFRKLLIGQDPRPTERLWDKMYRDAVRGRKGATMMAISAIDCALWDLKGQWLQQPVHVLLGGPVRTKIPAYASMLGYSLEPEKVAARVKEIVAQGFSGIKWFPRYGPTDGREGMRHNLELMQTVREAAGPDIDIMLDPWMSWDVPYTIAFAKKIAEYEPWWIEEPVLPDKIETCAEIRRLSAVPIATGEHEYTRWGHKQLLDARAADVLQPDTYWAGGISEMMKICAMASTYDIPVIPHGHSIPANIQLIAALPATTAPLAEYLVKWNVVQHFWKEPVQPVNGSIAVPTRPGMGVELDPAKIESERDLQWSDGPTSINRPE
jgi:L-alanine-DL-glutamate epimerase-like enolase superfamily enzyme